MTGLLKGASHEQRGFEPADLTSESLPTVPCMTTRSGVCDVCWRESSLGGSPCICAHSCSSLLTVSGLNGIIATGCVTADLVQQGVQALWGHCPSPQILSKV